jgi:hypothetical protein
MTQSEIETTSFRVLAQCPNQKHHRVAMICTLLTKYYSGDEMKKRDMGGACGTHCVSARDVQGFGKEPEGKIPQGTPRRK